MERPRQEYPALLASLHPAQALNILTDRIRLINKVNGDIADWLQECRRVEEAYAQGLRRLAHRLHSDSGATLGVFQLPWQRILNATEVLASSHETLAQKIEGDVERPLREYGSKNRDLHAMPVSQIDLGNLVRDLEMSQKKVDKAKEKGAKGADKLASAVNSMADSNQQWESRAPSVFEQLQVIDESRINHLRDVLTQFVTHEIDQFERCREAAESCLNVLLNVETADEIKTFAEKVASGGFVTPRRQDTLAPPSVGTSLAPTQRVQDDNASQRSERSGTVRSPPEPPARHTHLGGLKRLGTVMNRRKSNAQASNLPEKKSRSPFASFKRPDSGGDIQTPRSPQTGSDRPNSAMAATGSHTFANRRLSGLPEHEALRSTPAVQDSQTAVVATNGTTPSETQLESHVTDACGKERRVDSDGYTERPATVDEITRAQREAAAMEEPALNLTIRDQPIVEDEGQAKRAMDDMANTLRLQAQQTGIRRNASTLRGRRDVRNTVFIPSASAPVQEAPGPQSTSVPTTPAFQPKHIISPSSATDDHTSSDTTSIRSSHTLHSLSGPVVHPEMHDVGLNASIVETVSAWFTDGAVTKSFVVGELALAYNPGNEETPQGVSVRIDNFQILEKVAANPHFVKEALKDQEKESREDERKGEYEVQLTHISRSMPTVAFKYQVHIDPSDASAYCPVIFRPIWNLEDSRASAIIQYSANPLFTSSSPMEAMTLKNVVLTVNLDTSPDYETPNQPREVAQATAAVMHPTTGAKFRRKQSGVVWRIPELEIKPDNKGKFLVRFSTTGGRPRKGKAEAKFELFTTAAGTTRLGISAAAEDPDVKTKETDPFADEDMAPSTSPVVMRSWKEVSTIRKLAAGKYVSA